MLRLVCGLAVAAAAATSALAPVSAGPLAIDEAFAAFWAAAGPDEAQAAARQVVESGVGFDEAVARLRQGRPYSADVPRGVVRLSHRIGSRTFKYTLDVPAGYDPARRWPVRVHLHGGVSRPDPSIRGDGSIGTLAGADQIYVLPIGWADAPWWSEAQVASLTAILERLQRTYNVDENRVVLSGHSDGATAVFYFAMRDTTPFASFLPLNGFIKVLTNRSLAIGEELFPNNLRNKPWFVVNGGQDPLYPAAAVQPYLEHFRTGGLQLEYHPQPDGGHNTRWWPDLKERFEGFVAEHPRDPHPERLTWETDMSGASNRAHWLVIDRLAPRTPAEPLQDLNDMASGTEKNLGIRTRGMRVTRVLRGSGADELGLLPDDLVLRVNGRPLPAGVDLTAILELNDPGAPLTLVVSRGGAELELRGTYVPTSMPRFTPLFDRSRPSGRVDLEREGNVVRATTRGVAALTLLLSADAFDFDRPIRVVANGRTAFEGRVTPAVETLMTWAARDHDRTMLYGAELTVQVP